MTVDLANLSKKRQEKEEKERLDSNMKLAQELYETLKEENLQVQDAMIVAKFLTDIIHSKSGQKIQQTYLNHLD